MSKFKSVSVSTKKEAANKWLNQTTQVIWGITQRLINSLVHL